MIGLIEADTVLLSVRFVLCGVPVKFHEDCYHKTYVQSSGVKTFNLPLHSTGALLGLLVTRGNDPHIPARANGAPITLVKLRAMRKGEEHQNGELWTEDNAIFFKLNDDPRLTPGAAAPHDRSYNRLEGGLFHFRGQLLLPVDRALHDDVEIVVLWVPAQFLRNPRGGSHEFGGIARASRSAADVEPATSGALDGSQNFAH